MSATIFVNTLECQMLVTILSDSFTKNESQSIVVALEECCSVHDTYGFSSAAVYCFWNPKTKEILYVGISRVIAIRIMQHLGLIECDADCCKREQIGEYFKKNNEIGLTLLLQSPMEQPFSNKVRKELLTEFPSEIVQKIEDEMDGSKNVTFAEGMLIGLHDLLGDKLPPWNKMHGSKEGRESLGHGSLTKRLAAVQKMVAGQDIEEIEKQVQAEGPVYEHLDYLTLETITPMHAHCTLRELSSNVQWAKYEVLLHGVRLRSIIGPANFERNLESVARMDSYDAETIQEMMHERYLDRYPQI